MTQRRLLISLEAASVALFFLQALRVVLSVMFGVIYDQIFEGPVTAWLGMSNLLVLAALLAPALTPRGAGRAWLSLFACLAALARVGLTVNDPQVRYWGALVVLAAGGLYLSGLISRRRARGLQALVVALVLDQVLRVAGHTYDVSLRPGWLPLQILWAALVVGLALRLRREAETNPPRAGGFGVPGALALGGLLFLETSLLALPNAVARWSDWSYAVLAPSLLGLTLLTLALWSRSDRIRGMGRGGLPQIALVGALAVGLLIGYFASGLPAALALLVAQAAAMVALTRLAEVDGARPRRTGAALALGFFVLLVLNFLNAFAFTYPYTLPWMRGLGWAVYLAGVLLVGLTRNGPRSSSADRQEAAGLPGPVSLAAGLLALGIAVVAVWPQPAAPLPDTGRLRIGTYNIHYGYDNDWAFTLEAMARTIEENRVDVVALQEVDAGRLTSYGVDDALYLARRLRMNVAYLPTVEHLTGVALLYRGPAATTDERLLSSLQEQTGVVHVDLAASGRSLDAYGVWLGLSNEDTVRQIREALAFIGDRSPAVFGGDFNAAPDSPVVQAILRAGFQDPFAALGVVPAPATSPAIRPERRIDYVWLRGLEPVNAWVGDSLASDHRLVVVEVDWTR